MAADHYQVYFGDQARPADDAFHALVDRLEVEENADLPGAFELSMPIAKAALSDELSLIGDERWQPYARIAVVATPDGGQASCIFDGCVLSHKIHLERSATASTLKVWGQDVTCLMNLKEVVKAWDGKHDGAIANEIFGTYSFQTAPANEDSELPTHTERDHVLYQRATDAQFLRERARRDGKLFRVCCDAQAGQNTGYFFTPDLGAAPDLKLVLNPTATDEANIDALDFEWDVARPGRVLAHVLLAEKDPHAVDTRESGVDTLSDRSLSAFIGNDEHLMESRLTAAASSAQDLKLRASSLLREAGWFVRAEGECDLARLKRVVRAARVVEIAGAGGVHSGKYFVWSVRHSITRLSHRMRFVLVRNALGTQRNIL